MKPALIIEKAARVGVTLSFSLSTDNIKVNGDQQRVNELVPLIRANKDGLIHFLLKPTVVPVYPQPFIVNDELRIPTNCNPKYKWWAGGQSILDTLLELKAPDSTIEKYIGEIESPDNWRRWQQIKQTEVASYETNNKAA